MNEYNEYSSFSHTWQAMKDPFFPVLKAKDALKALENNSENVLTKGSLYLVLWFYISI